MYKLTGVALSEEIKMFDPWNYDADDDKKISVKEALKAISDYFAKRITKAQCLQVISLYFKGEHKITLSKLAISPSQVALGEEVNMGVRAKNETNKELSQKVTCEVERI